MADASIVVDRATWLSLSPAQRSALIDHELQHFERVLDDESERPKSDAIGRPKLAMRKHDHQFGWFDEIAQRHGDASFEVRQAKQLIEHSGQLYFDFARKTA
jgi:putative metallopeptidase